MSRVVINDPRLENPIEYYMEDRLYKNLKDKVIPALDKKDKDRVIVIDGSEGSGKSTFAFQIGKFVDPTLDLTRVTFSADEFREAVLKAKKGQCIIYDEAFTGFSSRASLSSINRVLVSLMMQMRQNNLFVIVVLPTFFLLDKYVALFRTIVLIHVYEVRGVRGYFKVYNRKNKKLLYLFGKITYSYNHKKVPTSFKGRFYGKFALGDEKDEDRYRKKKAKALSDTEVNPLTAGQAKYKEQRDVFLHLVRKYSGLTYHKLSELFEEYGIIMSYVQVQTICAKFGDKADKSGGNTVDAPGLPSPDEEN